MYVSVASDGHRGVAAPDALGLAACADQVLPEAHPGTGTIDDDSNRKRADEDGAAERAVEEHTELPEAVLRHSAGPSGGSGQDVDADASNLSGQGREDNDDDDNDNDNDNDDNDTDEDDENVEDENE